MILNPNLISRGANQISEINVVVKEIWSGSYQLCRAFRTSRGLVFSLRVRVSQHVRKPLYGSDVRTNPATSVSNICSNEIQSDGMLKT